ncbi:RidA family protein [Acetobacteraceae bacterium H6797]|nr:RidA family protein [Acetobacteraceae bacterium H6797]
MASTKLINPPEVHDTAGRYAHAVAIEGSHKRLVMSGQIGVRPDGTTAEGGEAQIEQALANIGAILASQGMDATNIVKMTVFLTDAALIPAWRERRNRFLAGHVSASTLLIVAGLASPEFLVEVEAEAVA